MNSHILGIVSHFQYSCLTVFVARGGACNGQMPWFCFLGVERFMGHADRWGTASRWRAPGRMKSGAPARRDVLPGMNPGTQGL